MVEVSFRKSHGEERIVTLDRLARKGRSPPMAKGTKSARMGELALVISRNGGI